jgi:hypothetical protein
MSSRKPTPKDTKPQSNPKPLASPVGGTTVLGGSENSKGPKIVQVDPKNL